MSKLKTLIRKSPCGAFPGAPNQEWEPNQIVIRLNDSMVTPRGYQEPVPQLIQFLTANGAESIRTLRYLDLAKRDKYHVAPSPHAPGYQILYGIENQSSMQSHCQRPFQSEAGRRELALLQIVFRERFHPQLLRCLNVFPGLRFAERVPVIRVAHEAPGNQLARTSKASNSSVNGPWWQTEVKFDSKAKAARIAVLDDEFNPQSNVTLNTGQPNKKSLTHGTAVCAMALHFADTEILAWGVQEKSYSLGKWSHSAYLTAMQSIRMNDKLHCWVVIVSRGTPTWTKVEWEEIQKMDAAGIVVVAAGGQNHQDHLIHYPAGYFEVLSVGAIDQTRSWSTQCNFKFHDETHLCLPKKVDAIDVVAPGYGMKVTAPGVWQGEAKLNGTSYAAPVVAALAATIREMDSKRSLTASDIRQIIQSTAVAVNFNLPASERDQRPVGSGLIHWQNAINEAKNRLNL